MFKDIAGVVGGCWSCRMAFGGKVGVSDMAKGRRGGRVWTTKQARGGRQFDRTAFVRISRNSSSQASHQSSTVTASSADECRRWHRIHLLRALPLLECTSFLHGFSRLHSSLNRRWKTKQQQLWRRCLLSSSSSCLVEAHFVKLNSTGSCRLSLRSRCSMFSVQTDFHFLLLYPLLLLRSFVCLQARRFQLGVHSANRKSVSLETRFFFEKSSLPSRSS